mmetsp:Transcript_145026/g.205246  ORF Transcript_145026/g.205246 Transcript_145026/m.205246 type:complete len:120 (-) Transcript_145026:287-646(-)
MPLFELAAASLLLAGAKLADSDSPSPSSEARETWEAWAKDAQETSPSQRHERHERHEVQGTERQREDARPQTARAPDALPDAEEDEWVMLESAKGFADERWEMPHLLSLTPLDAASHAI